MERLYQVTTAYFCCGMVTTAGIGFRVDRISAAAPIMAWTIGKPFVQVLAWIEKKGGKVREVSYVEIRIEQR